MSNKKNPFENLANPFANLDYQEASEHIAETFNEPPDENYYTNLELMVIQRLSAIFSQENKGNINTIKKYDR